MYVVELDTKRLTRTVELSGDDDFNPSLFMAEPAAGVLVTVERGKALRMWRLREKKHRDHGPPLLKCCIPELHTSFDIKRLAGGEYAELLSASAEGLVLRRENESRSSIILLNFWDC